LRLEAICPLVALQQIMVGSMPRRIGDASIGGWRVVASAWLAAVMFVVLLATVQALASRHAGSARNESLAGAVIPRHDPSVPGPDEVAASDWLERARAEAYSAW
jgi:hypothetical protein